MWGWVTSKSSPFHNGVNGPNDLTGGLLGVSLISLSSVFCSENKMGLGRGWGGENIFVGFGLDNNTHLKNIVLFSDGGQKARRGFGFIL